MTRKQFLALSEETSKRIYKISKKGNKFIITYANILSSNTVSTEKTIVCYAENWKDLANNFL